MWRLVWSFCMLLIMRPPVWLRSWGTEHIIIHHLVFGLCIYNFINIQGSDCPCWMTSLRLGRLGGGGGGGDFSDMNKKQIWYYVTVGRPPLAFITFFARLPLYFNRPFRPQNEFFHKYISRAWQRSRWGCTPRWINTPPVRRSRNHQRTEARSGAWRQCLAHLHAHTQWENI